MLLPELTEPSVIVMDNAGFHPKKRIRALMEKAGHVLPPLPKYSPDFNPIEQSFATITKRRQLANNEDIKTIIMGNL